MITNKNALNSARILSAIYRLCLVLSITQAGFLTGCTGSVHPLLTEKDLFENTDLSGKWILEIPGEDDKKQKIPIALDRHRHETSTYDLTISEELLQGQAIKKTKGPEWPEEWTFQIGKIDGQLYGQLIPRELPTGPPVAFGIPVYWLGKVKLSKDNVEFLPLRDDRASVAVRANLPHVKYGRPLNFVEMTVFTMPTADLQKMVTMHGNLLFHSRGLVLRRLKGASN